MEGAKMILAIYGAGGLGREIFDIATRINAKSARWQKIVFIDDFNEEGVFSGGTRLRFESLNGLGEQIECVVGIGEPSSREKLFQKIQNAGLDLATLIDPTALVSPTAKLGAGTVICEFATIHAGVEIHANVLIQPFCNIGHDIKVGNHSVLSSYCSPGGGLVFGDRVYAGMHSTLKEMLKVGDDAIVGMGAVVYQDVPAKATVIGNPARVTRGNDDHKVFVKKS